jgi:hypothetical protein
MAVIRATVRTLETSCVTVRSAACWQKTISGLVVVDADDDERNHDDDDVSVARLWKDADARPGGWHVARCYKLVN